MYILILKYCLPSLDCPPLTVYTYFPTSTLVFFPPLIYFRTSRLGCLLFHGDILTLLESPSMPCITFISLLTALPTAIVLLSFFDVDGLTRHIIRVGLLVPFQPVLLEPFKVLSGLIQCDKMCKKLWVGSDTLYLNSIFSWSVDFVLVSLAFLT